MSVASDPGEPSDAPTSTSAGCPACPKAQTESSRIPQAPDYREPHCADCAQAIEARAGTLRRST